MHASILVALATYNEISSLPQLVEDILTVVPDVHVLVVDDNSPDGTGDWLRERIANDARLHALHRPCKMGLGSATVDAMRYAADQNYDLLVTMDADYSHHPRFIPELLYPFRTSDKNSPATPVDVAVGSRYVRGGSVQGWPWRRRLMSRLMNGYARVWLGLPTRDCSGAFRCYRVETLRRLGLASVRADGYAFFEEILWRIQAANGRIVEVPILFTDRMQGATKLDSREALRAVMTIATLPWSRE